MWTVPAALVYCLGLPLSAVSRRWVRLSAALVLCRWVLRRWFYAGGVAVLVLCR